MKLVLYGAFDLEINQKLYKDVYFVWTIIFSVDSIPKMDFYGGTLIIGPDDLLNFSRSRRQAIRKGASRRRGQLPKRPFHSVDSGVPPHGTDLLDLQRRAESGGGYYNGVVGKSDGHHQEDDHRVAIETVSLMFCLGQRHVFLVRGDAVRCKCGGYSVTGQRVSAV